jgi:hypothetical protein
MLKLDSVDQTYMVYLWIKYLRLYTMERIQDRGSNQLGVFS